MNRELLKTAEQYHKKRKRRSVWRNALGALGCLVVFCTTYALILPALTMEKESFCGFVEHVHEESCYGIPAAPRHGVCTAESLGIHVHTDSCYSGGVLTCGKADFVAHVHSEDCRNEDGTLWCPLPEVTTHTHGEGCYTPADAGHSHSDDCYALQRGELLCVLPETAGHSHGGDCYTMQVGALLCTKAEGETHVHSESCYEQTAVLTCTLSEEAGHSHGDDCHTVQAGALLCTESETHTHDESCYEQTSLLTCTLPEEPAHSHEDSCYDCQSVLACGQEERPATEATLICTRQEQPLHQHSDSCYSGGVLTCGKLQLESHVHSESCFVTETSETEEPQLICDVTEHSHELICFSDTTADVESKADWEATLPETLSGTAVENLLAVAQSQIGYKESVKNYTVLADGTTMQGYSRYGHWYGNRYGDWCAMFAAFCLHYADIPRSAMPYDANCGVWVDMLKAKGQYLPAADYTPVPGDIIFFDYNATQQADHVGIVLSVDSESGKITTIEGNHSRRVDTFRYNLNESDILGYGVLRLSDGRLLTQQTLSAEIYTDSTYTTQVQDGTTITVSGLLPEGAIARAYPVELETDVVDGRLLICAYDITIFDENGEIFQQTPEQDTFTVTIQPADWAEDADQGDDYTVYYIPEVGDAEAMDTRSEDAAIAFTTDHFSTYALTTGGTAGTVYLNGASGNDSNTGTSANAAVKTLEKAMALVKNGGTIYITGTVTVSDTQEWVFSGSNTVTIQRHSSFTGPLITVASGGSLTLSNITINGGSGTPTASTPDYNKNISNLMPDIGENNTYAKNSAKAPLIVINGGGRMTLQAGAVLERNSNKPDTSNNKFKENGYVGLGGAIYCNGTLTMNGGLIQYCEAQCGGGVYIEDGSFYLTDGTIDHNYARDIEAPSNTRKSYHKNAGGGVFVGENSTMVMSGGTISYNESSREGGGISLGWLNRDSNAYFESYISTFTMNGGTLTYNLATSTGGGLNVTAGYQAFINAGYITHNIAYGNEYQPSSSSSYSSVYSGGGIYVDANGWKNGSHYGVPGKVVINRALITNNTASSNGGGIASCGTSTNFVYGDSTNGTAFYGNHKFGESTSNELYISTDSSYSVSDYLLGGGKYNWPTPTSSSGSKIYKNSLTESSAAVKTARSLATVFITDNYAHLGGGIGCNGLIEIGGEKYESTYINIEKKWEDDGTVVHPEFIEVQILQNGKPYGEPIRIYRTYDAQGKEIWPTFYVGGLPSGYTYTIEELAVPGYEATISKNGQNFVITNKPVAYQVTKKWVGDEETDRPDFITVQLYQNGLPYGDPVTLTAANGWSYNWETLPKKDSAGNAYTYTAAEVSVPDGYYSTSPGQLNADGQWVITNTKSPTTALSVEKVWEDGTPGAPSVTVQLLQNGNVYREGEGKVELSAGNNWFYKWEDLPTLDSAGNDIVYSVQEVPVPGYDFSVEKTTRTEEGELIYSWSKVSADSLPTNTPLLFVSSSGALAGSGNSGLQGLDVTAQLASGELPADAAVWTYSSRKLQNADGKYLYVKYSYNTYTYTFTTNSSGSNISFSNGRLYTSDGIYLSNISGTTSTSSKNAISFTVYQRTSERGPSVTNDHFIITNVKKPATLNVGFAKYSTGTDANGKHIFIEGAELSLYRLPEGTDIPTAGEVTSELLDSWTKIDSWTSGTILSETKGIHTVELNDGKYCLVETKAPPGHRILSGPIFFEVADGTVTVLQAPTGSVDSTTTDENGTVILPVYNTLVLELPETGGPGTHLYTTGGLLLTAAAAILLLYSHSKRRKEDLSSS